MKVSSTGGVSATGASRAKPAGGSSGFSLPSVNAASGAASTASVGGLTGVGSVDALLALQAAGSVGGPLERRKRAVRRADNILDILGEVRIALIDGDISHATLDRLSRAIREQREATDDPRLEGVLNEIETRAAVELAKLQARAG
ncbi:flagellar assembly protein FliX [Caulobacter vibrioides]|uniref:Flagellar assembly protein FliX n=2 Tax=Caulobacter vibrioides TaxID=155892 RepID=FLIX_CAUVC|nr:flagellar assembly regulator FliX [Caulobacter vibrioides]YP_002518037.1 flagellar assembly regulator FliX [Caulobacter vibrioides NA1000]O32348.1 RecName: Full=Flagellar assembly protein FliX [Caulobacter vibrioides CB15]AAB83953.1 FliX [Caulobacter vibrioides CB15]AAK24551.1 fliX protein [Caulobacter vibrioides CB15]ACL96129.1 flagellar assembly regulator FliX [Caulobacter vibrioides NA1000]ATC25570.1 flagellar assembly protein FliX [Caulobacter vibrioides]ATC29431.1 flagellar assembly 